MLASVFSPPAVRSKRTPATPTLVTGVTPGAYGRRDHSHQYYAYGRRVSNQRERQELADQAALAPVVAVAPIAAPIAVPVPAAKPKAATPHAPPPRLSGTGDNNKHRARKGPSPLSGGGGALGDRHAGAVPP